MQPEILRLNHCVDYVDNSITSEEVSNQNLCVIDEHRSILNADVGELTICHGKTIVAEQKGAK